MNSVIENSMKMMVIPILIVIFLSVWIPIMIINAPDLEAPIDYVILDFPIRICASMDSHNFVGHHGGSCSNYELRDSLGLMIPIIGSIFGATGIILLIRSYFEEKQTINQ